MAAPGATPSAPESDEPKTPLWLTFLGGALFLLAGIYILVTREPEPEPAAVAPTDAPAEAAVAPAPVPPPH